MSNTPFAISRSDARKIEADSKIITVFNQNFMDEHKLNTSLTGEEFLLRYFVPERTLGLGESGTVKSCRIISKTIDVNEADLAIVNTTKVAIKFQRYSKDWRILQFRKMRDTLVEFYNKISQINGLVPIYAVWCTDVGTYIMMPIIDGSSMAQQQKFTNDTEISAFFRDLCSTLSELHHSGHIHFDIKPENIIQDRKTGKYILVDLALLTNLQGEEVYKFSLEGGDNQYLAPEVLNSSETRPITSAVDMYSLGMTVKRLLAKDITMSLELKTIIERLCNTEHPVVRPSAAGVLELL